MASARLHPPPVIEPAQLRRTLTELIDIYSPAGKEEDIQLYLEQRFQAEGLPVTRQEVEEDRWNLLLTLGKGEPLVWLVGHVDTVAAWDLETFAAIEEGDTIRGLGSTDMKGGCAAMVEAWLALATLPTALQPAAGLLLVVGEEENGDGSARFLQERQPPWVVIGEPTGLTACFAHFGYMEADLVTRGRRIHSSLPELGHNAVESMLRVLLHLGRDPLFDREQTPIVYSIRELTSARAGFVVPDRCETWIDLHLPPELSPATVETGLRARLASAPDFIPELDLDLSIDFASAGYDLGTDHPPARQLQEIYADLGLPLQFDAFRSHSDGNLFFQAGVKPLILGPGALETAHTPDECTSFAQVLAAANIYLRLCLSLGRA